MTLFWGKQGQRSLPSKWTVEQMLLFPSSVISLRVFFVYRDFEERRRSDLLLLFWFFFLLHVQRKKICFRPKRDLNREIRTVRVSDKRDKEHLLCNHLQGSSLSFRNTTTASCQEAINMLSSVSFCFLWKWRRDYTSRWSGSCPPSSSTSHFLLSSFSLSKSGRHR